MSDLVCATVFHPKLMLPADEVAARSPWRVVGGLFVMSGVCLMVGFVFWPLLFLAAIFAVMGIGGVFVAPISWAIKRAALRGVWQGLCPYCGFDTIVRHDITGFNCPQCQQRVLRTEAGFRKIPT